jgi:hypothetical protein
VTRLLFAGALLSALCASGCGYHVAGHVNALPPSVHSIAVSSFGNATIHYNITQQLAAAITRELIQRTHYQVTADPTGADAVISGALTNFNSYPTTFDPTTGRASGIQVIVRFQVSLRDKSGKVLFNRPDFELRERYEISVDPNNYFDESAGASERLSRDAAQSIVSAILENF